MEPNVTIPDSFRMIYEYVLKTASGQTAVKLLILKVQMAPICENDRTPIKGKFQALATWLQFRTKEYGETPERRFVNALETVVCKYFLLVTFLIN